MGKLVEGELKKLLSLIKKTSKSVVPPLIGYDSGVHKINDKYLVVSTDPCVGVPNEYFGWLLINYAASDVALFGAKPEFCTINLLGPPKTTPKTFLSIMEQTSKAAEEINMTIVTGHTGTYEGISKIIGICTAYGTVEPEKLITPGRAQPGDIILFTKSIGLEIIVNLAITKKNFSKKIFGVNRTQKLQKMVHTQSCVKEALQLSQIEGVHAMHDTTEGGLITALNELADASELGFKIEDEKLPISFEVKEIKKRFNLTRNQVLSMSSTGSILAAIHPDSKSEVVNLLSKKGLSSTLIGNFTKNQKKIILQKGKEIAFPKKAKDPYGTILLG